MLNGEFKRIEKNRNMLSRYLTYDGEYKMHLIKGDLYYANINGNVYYFLLSRDTKVNSMDCEYKFVTHEFYTGTCLTFGKTKRECLQNTKIELINDIYHENCGMYCLQNRISECLLNLFSKTQNSHDTDYLYWLIDRYQRKLKKARGNMRKNILHDIDALRNFINKGGNEND